jgi:hypothetical protein
MEQAAQSELACCDLHLAMSGDPVSEHDVQAGFLGVVLTKAQGLINALAQATEQRPTERGSIANSLVEEYRLLVSAFAPSSFAVKLRFHSDKELGRLRLAKVDEVLGNFCCLIDPGASQADLVKLVSVPRVQGHYYGLIDAIGKEGAELTVRTKRQLAGVRISAKQARDRIAWMDSLTETTTTLNLEGVLTGGSIATNRFELLVEPEFYRGRISPEAKTEMRQIKLGDPVSAEIVQTTFVVDEAVIEGHVTYYLKKITPAG